MAARAVPPDRASAAWATTTAAGCPRRSRTRSATPPLEAVLAWRDGRPVAIPTPAAGDARRDDRPWRWASPCPPEYGDDDRRPDSASHPSPRRRSRSTCPRASRCSSSAPASPGICAAINLQTRRHPVHRHREEHRPSGGTWLDNRYPGAGVDTPEPPLLVLLRPVRLVDVLRAARRAARVPRARRRPLRPARATSASAPRSCDGATTSDAQRWAVTVRRAGRHDRGAPTPTS